MWGAVVWEAVARVCLRLRPPEPSPAFPGSPPSTRRWLTPPHPSPPVRVFSQLQTEIDNSTHDPTAFPRCVRLATCTATRGLISAVPSKRTCSLQEISHDEKRRELRIIRAVQLPVLHRTSVPNLLSSVERVSSPSFILQSSWLCPEPPKGPYLETEQVPVESAEVLCWREAFIL